VLQGDRQAAIAQALFLHDAKLEGSFLEAAFFRKGYLVSVSLRTIWVSCYWYF